MKLRLLLVFLGCLSTASFAQRFGIDAGCGYTANTLGVAPEGDYRLAYTETTTKQLLWPNISLRPYIQLYKKISFYFGADLMKYKVKHSLYFSDKPVYNYTRWLMTSEVQLPAMIRLEVLQFKDKYPLAVYGGIFARFPVWTKEYLWDEGLNAGSADGAYYNSAIYLREKKQKYINFAIGLHQGFLLKSYLHLYIDLQAKYLSGDYYLPGSGFARLEPMYIQHKYIFTGSIGVSLFKPGKKSRPETNPGRLQD